MAKQRVCKNNLNRRVVRKEKKKKLKMKMK